MSAGFYKIFFITAVGFGISFADHYLLSGFSTEFSNNLLALLTTLFAINIASSTLIASKLKELEILTKHPFTKSKKDLKYSFYEQVILIALTFVVAMLRESKVLHGAFSSSQVLICSNALLFSCFIYFLDIIRDIGKALFDLMDFDTDQDQEKP